MCDSIMGIAEGISSQATANTDSQLSTGLTVIDLVTIYLALQTKCSKELSVLAEDIYIANCNLPGNPEGTAEVAEATQKRNVASTQFDLETGNVDQIIQGQKGQAQILGNSMTAIFSLEDPINELLKVMTDILQQ
jgi:hypothetical protein